ncbi:hypothetical protein ACJJTC_009091 [Scirpophaga incertulas]
MSDNIKVVVKVRPLIAREIEEKLSYQWRIKNNTLYQLDQKGKDFGPSFTFDKVYEEKCKTTEIYNDVAKPIVEAAIAGVNGTIFAYGQTSSGKTYTMSGTDDSPGIIPLAVYNLYKTIKNIPNRDFLVRVSYIEIYNDMLRDLLNLENNIIKVSESRTNSGVKVDCSEHVTTSPEEVLKYLREGEVNRQTCSTNMNEESSRSHSIFQITIESREHIEGEEETGCVNVSTLNLVDLAGSERSGQTGTTGIRFKEGTHINKSLSNLGLVIKQLSEDPNKFVNYRDSKLTRILQNSLGGNAKTSIICAITPAAVEETISTLQFANRAKAIKNKPEVNAVATDATMIQSLTKQLSRLQSQLESKKNLEVMLETKKNVEQDNYNLQKQIAALQKLILNGFGQRSSLESRRKIGQSRRITISTLYPIEENPVPILPKLHTPLLKYNPLTMSSSDFIPIQNMSKLSQVSEETEIMVITPPPPTTQNPDKDEVIIVDSDDDNSSLDITTCSPYHKCYGSSKTPPCILRKTAKTAEKNLKEIVELTEREKIYMPSVIELIEKLEQNASVITTLQEEMTAIHKQSKDKDLELDQLKIKVSKSNEEIKSVKSEKSALELLCSEYTTKLTDWEVMFETLQKKSKQREEELLSLLEEQKSRTVHKTVEDYDKLPKKCFGKEINFMNISKDISLVNSDMENSIDNNKDTLQLHNMISVIQNESTSTNPIIQQLEATIQAQNSKIDMLNASSQKLQITIDGLQESILITESENSVLKSTVETLQSTIQSQKLNLESAHNDIESYNGLIQELQVKLTNKDNIKNVVVNESVIESMIANEEQFIANNDNIKNIINCLRCALNKKDQEIESLKSNTQVSSTDCMKDADLKSECEKNEVNKLKSGFEENIKIINKLMEEKQNYAEREINLTRELTEVTKKHEELEISFKECKENFILMETKNSLLLATIAEKDTHETLMTETIKKLNESISNLKKDIITKDDILTELNMKKADNKEKITEIKSCVYSLKNTIIKLIGCEFNMSYDNINDLETIKNLLNILNSKLIDKMEHLLQSERDHNGNKIVIEQLTKERENMSSLLNSNNKKINSLEYDLKICKEDNEILKTELVNKDDMISALKDKESVLQNQLQSLQEQNKVINDVIIQRGELKEAIYSKENIITQNEMEFMKQHEILSKLENDLMEKSNTIENLHEKNRKVIDKNCTELCKIYNLIITLIDALNIDKNSEVNLYENIVNSLHQIKKCISDMKYHDLEESWTLNQCLSAAKVEIACLKERNENLLDNIFVIKKNSNQLITFLEEIKQENEYLNLDVVLNSDTLKQLRKELNQKANDLEEIFVKSQCLKENVIGLHQIILNQITQLGKEKSNINLKIAERHMSDETGNVVDGNIRTSVGEKHFHNPSSLLTICYQKLLAMIHPEKSVSSSNSDFSIKHTDIYGKTGCDNTKIIIECESSLSVDCRPSKLVKHLESVNNESVPDHYYDKKECNHIDIISELQLENLRLSKHVKHLESLNEKLISTRDHFHENKEHDDRYVISELQSDNLRLSKLVTHLESVNEKLISDHEEIKREVELLLAPTYELQKKINNHKTNLSTLTATTYAENGLLKTQVKVLQHHHNRFHNVCHKDFPVLKKQLYELLTILKNDNSFIDKHYSGIKRFSLPCVLDNDSSLNNLKNDSTLDGDILMLDTNLTVTSTLDNTLTGMDQTYSDMTQIVSSTDVACQTVDENNFTQPINSKQCFENQCDHRDLDEKISFLITENERLVHQIKEYTQKETRKCGTQISPLKLNTLEPINVLEDSNTSDKLQTCLQKVADLTAEKQDLEKKYNTIMQKLTILEETSNQKHDELSRMTCLLREKTAEIKRLQEENDSLSTDVFEHVTENEELLKKVESLQSCNTELEKQLLETDMEKIAASVKCSRCLAKSNSMEITHNQDLHSKLNRSLSDSETTTRLNKISTLQNELHAGREYCKELHKEVSTIKSQLEYSNLSAVESMELDDSTQQSNKLALESNYGLDSYILEKTESLNYIIEKTALEKENFNSNMRFIEIVKILYTDIMSKHSSEVGNLVNNLKCLEDSKNEMESRLQNIMDETRQLTLSLQEKENTLATNINTLSLIKEEFNSVSEEILNISEDNNIARHVSIFKEKFLQFIDINFGLCSTNLFEKLIKSVSYNYEKDLSNINEQYKSLQANMETTTGQLNEKIMEMKSLLSDRENEYNLLKAQKEKMHDICSAVTLDLVKQKQDLCQVIKECCIKLKEINIFSSDIIDSSIVNGENVRLLLEGIVKECTIKISEMDVEKKCLAIKLDKSNSENEEYKNKVENMLTKINELQESKQLLNTNITELNNKLVSQKTLYDDLSESHKTTLDENNYKSTQIDDLTTQLKILQENILQKENIIQNLESDKQNNSNAREIEELLKSITKCTIEIKDLKILNEIITKEKEICMTELQTSKDTIETSKQALNKMTSDILALNESIRDNLAVIEKLKIEINALSEHNAELKGKLEKKCKDCERLEMNVKTHEKAVEIQCRFISRLQKQQEEKNNAITEKDSKIEELTLKCTTLTKECEDMNNNIITSKEEIRCLKIEKDVLECKLSKLELELAATHKEQAHTNASTEISRRQSIIDSKRMFSEDSGDHNKIEVVFDSRAKPTDLFMDVDEGSSNNSTPRRRSCGGNSLSRHEQSGREDEHSSHSSSVAAVRRRRQSIHDMHRIGVYPMPSSQENSSPKQNHSHRSSETTTGLNESDESQVRQRLAACQQELQELKERYRELDEECDTCAQYLHERDAQCARFAKENAALNKVITELKEKLVELSSPENLEKSRRTFADAAMNTDKDWSNLHAVVVDRMSYDIELERNKILTRTIEELRLKKHELTNTLSKMQKHLEKVATKDVIKELEATKAELKACKLELKELTAKYKELDDECETCSEYLKEREEQCRKLWETKAALESELQQYEEAEGASEARRRRRHAHDRARLSQEHSYEEDNDSYIKEITRLKSVVDELTQQKESLEKQCALVTPAANPMYIATGSAIVQNQQITDVLKENQMLKKKNAKLIKVCMKRGKQADIENIDISEKT